MENYIDSVCPLVSVIIPSYNHGIYLQEAFNSIRQQGYPSVEIIVVDDGSTDNTRQVAESASDVIYIYQLNQGLSAARNTGIKHSKGEYLVFLDADDWLLPGSLQTNLSYLLENKDLAFVSGAHDKVFTKEGIILEEASTVNSNYYCQLLQGNYIGMHATVMYRRKVFDEFKYDVSLKACEDYDLYLNITKRYPVLHHTKKIAAYRLHSFNMSGNVPLMLTTVLEVLERQNTHVTTHEEKTALLKGHRAWKEYYCNEMYQKYLKDTRPLSKDALSLLAKYKPLLALSYIQKKNTLMLKSVLKKNAPAFGLRWLYKTGVLKHYTPGVGEIKKGDFKRTKPFSTEFGYDRGGPVDRYYIENFLTKESASVKGRVMEIGDNEYTLLFGGSKVTQSDILHVHEGNPKATLIGDISNAPQISDNLFDCIILTQTLHLIYDFKGALETCHRILKPGGTLLFTVPGITPIDHGEWKETWYWSFTDKALKRLMAETFPECNTEVTTFGNVYTATAFLYGMGVSEVSKADLDYQDIHFQVINAVKAVK